MSQPSAVLQELEDLIARDPRSSLNTPLTWTDLLRIVRAARVSFELLEHDGDD